jgi:hypothetical protein
MDCRSILSVPPGSLIAYHYIVSGQLLASVDGMVAVRAAADEAILFLRNGLHRLGSRLDHPTARRPGTDAIFARISELLFVEAVRAYLETLPEDRSSWLAGSASRPSAALLGARSTNRPRLGAKLSREL